MASGKPRYIDAVKVETLDEALENKIQDEGTRSLLDAELPKINAWRRAHDRQTATTNNLTGLALSGGGIRSATFCLGVIQALVRHDLFKRFDYLSTVSGGGYIGSSITWLTSHVAQEAAAKEGFDLKFDATEENFPYGSDDPRMPDTTDGSNQRTMLQYLRQHGNYLIPGNGITVKSGISVVLRGIIVNFLVWLPILSAIFFALFWIGQEFLLWDKNLSFLLTWILGWLGDWVDPTLLMKKFYEGVNRGNVNWQDFISRMIAFRLSFLLCLVLLALFILGSAFYSLATWIPLKKGHSRYLARRKVETWSGWILWLLLILFLVGTIPSVIVWLDFTVAKAGGIGAVLVGAATGVWGFLKSGRDKSGKGGGVPLGLISTVGAILLLYGVMLISFRLGYWVIDEAYEASTFIDEAYVASTFEAYVASTFKGGTVFWCASLALAVAVLLAFMVNLNYMTIHRYYRDRLMETFMPDIASALRKKTGAAIDADQAHMQSLWWSSRPSATLLTKIMSGIKSMAWWLGHEGETTSDKKSPPRSPYHIVNTNLMLVNSTVRRYRIRGGDNFILSPLYCGSNATGWRRTGDLFGGKLTLATAMAISGAAANPNTGVGGVGLTRNPAIAVLMGLLDIRLGYWVRRPRKKHSKHTQPNHIHPGFWEFINRGLKENAQFAQLSDGGHFENLALYELIRRRVRLIVCCDAGADAETSFSDFQVTLRRIRTDFGARVEFDGENNPDNLVAHHDAVYPAGAKVANRGHIVGNIIYADGSQGTLILLKTTLVPGLGLQLLGYKSANPTFPDQTTADQFFDEDQFEAYRELGYVIGSKMIEGTELKELITNVY